MNVYNRVRPSVIKLSFKNCQNGKHLGAGPSHHTVELLLTMSQSGDLSNLNFQSRS